MNTWGKLMKNTLIILIIFFVVSLLVTNIINSTEKTKEVTKLSDKITKLELEKKVNHRFLKMKLSKDKTFIAFDYFNPKYDPIVSKIKKFDHIDFLIELSNSVDLDWKFFAIQIFYESSYNASSTSNRGAKGLMQLTRFVYGKDSDPYNEIHNIFIGVTYFHYLYEKQFYYIKNDDEKLCFSLAAYHDGITNINLYRKKIKNDGLNPNDFKNIKKYLTHNCKQYVNNIMKTYNEIKNI